MQRNPKATEKKGVYTLKETADLLGYDKRTLMTFIESGDLKAVKLGRFWRITDENIQELLKNGTPNWKKAKAEQRDETAGAIEKGENGNGNNDKTA